LRLFLEFGILLSFTHNQTIEWDQINGTTKGKDAEATTEMLQLLAYSMFIDKGSDSQESLGYQKI
jgi:hypothetical protein